MTQIICPACHHTTELTPDGPVYKAPYHCPSCLGLYFVHIENDELVSCEPLTESGYIRWKQAQQGSQ